MMQKTRKIGSWPGELAYRVYVNGADRQSGMSLRMPNLSSFKRLVWLKFMFPIKFSHTDKNFPSISPLEKLIVAKSLEMFL